MITDAMYAFPTTNPVLNSESFPRVESGVCVSDDITVYGVVVCHKEAPEHARNASLDVADGDDLGVEVFQSLDDVGGHRVITVKPCHPT
mmetsp:Transcript_39593/g.51048  ORF Transcript_39593/g.51048 Transcript_39593/m.51048 type:complete len:89 (-) Transcript_39593:435-701(-)